MRPIHTATFFVLLLMACQGLGGNSSPSETQAIKSEGQPDEVGQVGAFLDAWHQAAAEADGKGYFGSIAEDGVFLGTDPGERWIRADFKATFQVYFEEGQESAWIYVPGRREINIEGQHAWFDEDLTNANYGQVRGTGVLRRKGMGWEIVQYNLHFTVPNGVATEVVKAIRGHAPADG